jgi:hypothetical protein
MRPAKRASSAGHSALDRNWPKLPWVFDAVPWMKTRNDPLACVALEVGGSHGREVRGVAPPAGPAIETRLPLEAILDRPHQRLGAGPRKTEIDEASTLAARFFPQPFRRLAPGVVDDAVAADVQNEEPRDDAAAAATKLTEAATSRVVLACASSISRRFGAVAAADLAWRRERPVMPGPPSTLRAWRRAFPGW